ncbi:MAG: alanine dehydrogenase [Gammaproteobacteria bacterium]|nr:alanine dehydrogenase [Gammaproteobacteria bacterium]|tara:strand:+ start:531 stop:1616 length:1086 start_codon:yes stop_codon:yes gene_type:complete
MIIGVPREVKNNESRIGLTPESVDSLVKEGHEILIQKDAGANIGFYDSQYIQYGAKVVNSAEEVYKSSEMIVKVKEPTPDEYGFLREGLTLFTYLHLAGDIENSKKLIDTGVTGIAYETVTAKDGSMPLLAPMSTIAGQLAFTVGSYHLLKHNKGKGVMIGKLDEIEPRVVTVIGAGVAGTQSISKAIANNALVKVVDANQSKLDYLESEFGSTNIEYILSTDDSIQSSINSSDLVIGSVYVVGKEAPKVIRKEMLSSMMPGTVMVDVSIDQGGCFETSKPTTHDNPTFLENNIVHYCVTNMPGAVPLTATQALNKVTLPYIKDLANKGIMKALDEDKHLKNGLNIQNGSITHPGVREALE